MKLNFDDNLLDVSADGRLFTVSLDKRTIQAEIIRSEKGELDLLLNGDHVIAYVSSDNAKRWVTVNGQTFVLTRSSGPKRNRAKHELSGELTAPMPGQVRAVNVSEGDRVTKGQTLMLLEAMKMEIRIQAPVDGTVNKLFVKQGQTVEREQMLIEVS
jgi:biotin carboxyl carrier protein